MNAPIRRFACFFVGVCSVKVILNATRFFQCNSYLQRYEEWLKKGDESWGLVGERAKITQLIHDADVKEGIVPLVQPAGYGQLVSAQVPVLSNFPSNREDFAIPTLRMMYQARGTYRSRVLETFSPIFWIETVLKLPKRVLTYLGISSDSVVIRVAQLIYWAIAATAAFVITLYKAEIDALVRQFIGRWGH